MTSILVTGANGQLGSEIKDLAGNYPDLDFTYIDIEDLDLTDSSAVKSFMDAESFDFCINCAAYTAVDKAEDEPEKAKSVNVDAVLNLANSCRKHEVLMIHLSTDYVFNGKAYKPYGEQDETGPQSVYGATKLEGEKALAASGAPYLIIRTSWLYSAYGNNFVKTMRRLGVEKPNLTVVADQVGTPTNAADLARAILELMPMIMVADSGSIFHYSNEGVASWYDFARAVMQFSQLDCEVQPIESKDFPAKASRPFYSVLNKTKIKSRFDLQIPHWQDSLKKSIKKLSDQ